MKGLGWEDVWEEMPWRGRCWHIASCFGKRGDRSDDALSGVRGCKTLITVESVRIPRGYRRMYKTDQVYRESVNGGLEIL